MGDSFEKQTDRETGRQQTARERERQMHSTAGTGSSTAVNNEATAGTGAVLARVRFDTCRLAIIPERSSAPVCCRGRETFNMPSRVD